MILDTDVIIEVLRGNRRTSSWVKERWAAGDTLHYSPVTRAEVRSGARPAERATIAALFGSMQALPIEASTGDLAGDQLRRYARSHGVQLGDALIAAAALEHGQQLATFNRRHFPGVAKLAAPDR